MSPPASLADHEQRSRFADFVAARAFRFSLERHETHATPAHVGCDSPLGDDGFAGLRMARPFELLLRMQEPCEIDLRLRILEQLRRRGAERVDGGESRRYALGGVGADCARESDSTLSLDLEPDRRVGSSRYAPFGHAASVPPQAGRLGQALARWKRDATRRSSSGRRAAHASRTAARALGARSGGAYAATMKPSASERSASEASGNLLARRRASSLGVSPGRCSAPANRARARARLHARVTEPGRK